MGNDGSTATATAGPPAREITVLFVCTGNICRSPTAAGVFRHLADTSGLGRRVRVDSAGTHDYHVGEPPDRRTMAAARRRGYDLSSLRARAFVAGDFATSDYILCMDRGHLELLGRLQPMGWNGHLGLFLAFAPWVGVDEVPDPYYGGPAGFDRVLDLIEEGARSLLAEIADRTRR